MTMDIYNNTFTRLLSGWTVSIFLILLKLKILVQSMTAAKKMKMRQVNSKFCKSGIDLKIFNEAQV